METSFVLLELFIILVAARFLGEFVSKFSVPPVIGEILAGIIIGPSLFGWLVPDGIINLLADIGIVLLLFDIGLETDITKLVKTGYRPLLTALVGVITPLVLGFGTACYFFHKSTLVSLFIGGTLTATSIGITVRVMNDLRKQQTHAAQIVLGAAILDDIIGVILLAMLYNFAQTGTINIIGVISIFLSIVAFLILAPIAAKLLSFVIQRFEKRSEIPGILPATVVALILFFAWLAHAMGAPELLGGFAAGLALTQHYKLPFQKWHGFLTEPAFCHKVETQMKPIVQLFAPIFFVMVGLSLNLRAIDWSSIYIWGLSGGLLITAIIGKFASGLVLRGDHPFVRRVVGIAMIPRGEVGLIFAEIGRSAQILNNEVYAALIIVIAITTLLTPFALRIFYKKFGAECPAG